MKTKTPAPKLNVPATVTFTNGKKHVTMEIKNTRLEDWVDKSILLKALGCSDKTLGTLRKNKVIPCAKLGGSYRYYLPGILFILEQSAAS